MGRIYFAWVFVYKLPFTIKILMDRQISDFTSWFESGQTNGYYFQSSIRFIPGDNNAFYWKPLERPEVTDTYVRAEIFEQRGGNFISLGRTVELPLVIYSHNKAIPAHAEV